MELLTNISKYTTADYNRHIIAWNFAHIVHQHYANMYYNTLYKFINKRIVNETEYVYKRVKDAIYNIEVDYKLISSHWNKVPYIENILPNDTDGNRFTVTLINEGSMLYLQYEIRCKLNDYHYYRINIPLGKVDREGVLLGLYNNWVHITTKLIPYDSGNMLVDEFKRIEQDEISVKHQAYNLLGKLGIPSTDWNYGSQTCISSPIEELITKIDNNED